MSTDFEGDASSPDAWISQAEAARLLGVTRQAVSKLVRAGRLTTRVVGGRGLVLREQVRAFRPGAAGRPREGDHRGLDRIRRLLRESSPETRRAVLDELREEYPIHPLEAKLGVEAEVILGAIARSGELTLRMIRGVIAEAAFEVYVAGALQGWTNEPIVGDVAYDYVLRDRVGEVRVQVKLQRSEGGVPRVRNGMFAVETQRTRSGVDASGRSTRPYRVGEFDVLAVAMQPSTGRWDSFRYTVGRWLRSRPGEPDLLQVLQPLPAEPDDDWTDRFLTCVAWFRSGECKTIRGEP